MLKTPGIMIYKTLIINVLLNIYTIEKLAEKPWKARVTTGKHFLVSYKVQDLMGLIRFSNFRQGLL